MGRTARIVLLAGSALAFLLLATAESLTSNSTASSDGVTPWDEIPYIHQFSQDTPILCNVDGVADCGLASQEPEDPL